MYEQVRDDTTWCMPEPVGPTMVIFISNIVMVIFIFLIALNLYRETIYNLS